MNSIYTVISFGNYETKILACTFYDSEILPLYVSSFLTKNCLENSRIIDKELLEKILNAELKKLPINLNQTKVILNIPIKSIKIKHYLSTEYVVNTHFTQEFWDDFLSKFVSETKEADYIEIEKKFLSWSVNNKEFLSPPYNEKLNNFSFKMKSYLVEKTLINEYLDFIKNIIPKIDTVLCDSLVVHELFTNKERRYKVLFNIGHQVSSLEAYDNLVLMNQKTINFGIKDLTFEICKKALINEIKAIEILKIYKDLEPVNDDLPLINHFKEKYLEYHQTKIVDITKLITKWSKVLIDYLNNYLKFLFSQSFDVDEIYINSSTNIFKPLIKFIQSKLLKFVDLICLESNVFGINESKFLSLIASVINFKKNMNNK